MIVQTSTIATRRTATTDVGSVQALLAPRVHPFSTLCCGRGKQPWLALRTSFTRRSLFTKNRPRSANAPLPPCHEGEMIRYRIKQHQVKHNTLKTPVSC